MYCIFELMQMYLSLSTTVLSFPSFRVICNLQSRGSLGKVISVHSDFGLGATCVAPLDMPFPLANHCAFGMLIFHPYQRSSVSPSLPIPLSFMFHHLDVPFQTWSFLRVERSHSSALRACCWGLWTSGWIPSALHSSPEGERWCLLGETLIWVSC